MGFFTSDTEKHAQKPQKARNFTFSLPPTATTMNFTVGWPKVHDDGFDREFRRSRKHERRRRRSISPSISTSATTYDSQDSSSSCSDDFSSASSGRPSGFPIYSTPSYNSLNSQVLALVDAANTPLIWDVRQPLTTVSSSRSVSKIYGPNGLSFPLTTSGSGHVRILSQLFPWMIDIGPKDRAITASDVLHGIHDLLHKELDDTLWAFSDETIRTNMLKARERRCKNEDNLRNVDLLGKRVMFKGLYRDDKIVQQRLKPGSMMVAETWLVDFGKA